MSLYTVVACTTSRKTRMWQSQCSPFADFKGVSSSFFHTAAMPTLRQCSYALGGVSHDLAMFYYVELRAAPCDDAGPRSIDCGEAGWPARNSCVPPNADVRF